MHLRDHSDHVLTVYKKGIGYINLSWFELLTIFCVTQFLIKTNKMYLIKEKISSTG